ncbi:LysR substrate-binding domain-containing protein [Serratia sp. D1N4]
MDNINQINFFIQVVKKGSFVAAARTCGVAPSTISKSISKLESRLKIQLFKRSTRSMVLTNIGTQLYNRSLGVLAEIKAIEEEIVSSSDEIAGQVRISMAEQTLLLPAFEALMRAYPLLQLELEFTDRLVNVIEEGFDLVIRSGTIQDSRLKIKPLTTFSSKVVASADFLHRFGIPHHPDELKKYPCLHYRFPHSGKLETWQLREFSDAENMLLPKTLICNHTQTRMQFALSGIGLAWLPDYVIQPALANYSLRSVLDEYAIRKETLSLLWPADRWLAKRTRTVIDFLIDFFHLTENKTHSDWTLSHKPDGTT